MSGDPRYQVWRPVSGPVEVRADHWSVRSAVGNRARVERSRAGVWTVSRAMFRRVVDGLSVQGPVLVHYDNRSQTLCTTMCMGADPRSAATCECPCFGMFHGAGAASRSVLAGDHLVVVNSETFRRTFTVNKRVAEVAA